MTWRSKRTRAAALVALVAVLAYVNAAPNGFTNWDDRALVLAEPAAQSLSLDNIGRVLRQPVGYAYLPLRTLSYAVDYAIWGPHPAGYHLTNVLLHAANAALVLALVAALAQSLRLGFVVAVLFALHPIQTSAVTWIAGRRDVLSALFYLAAVVWYLRAMARGERALAAAGLLVLGCLSKATCVVFPAVALVLELFGPAVRKAPRLMLTRQAAAWLVAMGMVAVHVGVARQKDVIQPYHGRTFAHNLATSSKAVCRYVAAMAWPVGLCAKHEFPPVRNLAWLVGPVLLAAATALCLWRKRWRVIGLGGAWFLISLAPVSGVLFPLSHPYAERYLYVPGIGLLLAAGMVFASRASLAWLLAAGVVLASLTMQRSADWRSSQTLWRSAMRVYPESGDIAKALLFTHTEDGRPQCAAAIARRMPATDLDPYLALINQAQTFARLKRYVEARGKAIEAIARRPKDARGYVVAGDVERVVGDVQAAVNFYNTAISLEPDSFGAHFGLGVIEERRDPKAALEHYKAAVQANPDSAEAHYNLGNVACQLGYNNLAERAYRAAIRVKPGYAQAWCNLGALYKAQRYHKRALAAFQRAVEIDPDLPQAHYHLALYEEALGKRAQAIARLEALLTRRPHLGEVRRLLERMKRGGSRP